MLFTHALNGTDDICLCTLLPRNQHFCRQITSREKDGAVSGVGQW